MIDRLQLIRNVGQFDSVNANQHQLSKFTLLYAENGRGKTTLSAIFKSLSNGDPSIILERRRLTSTHPPHIVIADNAGSVVFQNGAWSRILPEIVVFDDIFVANNVCSGIEIDAEHRQNLHELIVGAQGVNLNATLQTHVTAVEEHNKRLRSLGDAIPAVARGKLNIEKFCELKPLADIDQLIEETERSLAAAQSVDAVRTTSGFQALSLPKFNLDEISTILQRDLPSLEAAAAARLQNHLSRLGREGESWVSDGMQHIKSASAGMDTDICPFCTQPLQGSSIIEHYKAYFSDAYEQLKQSITSIGKAIASAHGNDVPAAFERDVSVATQTRQFWSQFIDMPTFALDTEEIARTWKAAREGVLSALRSKYASPLERSALSEAVITAIAAYDDCRETIDGLSQQLQSTNDAILLLKEQTASANTASILAEIDKLSPIRARYEPEINTACQAYLDEKSAKSVTERARDQARAALDRYRTTIFPAYETAINMYLRRFGAAFRLKNVKQANVRSGSSCTYSVLINDVEVVVAAQSGPNFSNTLSAGDRNTLALAFFFASLENDPSIGQKIAVIDDPMTSLDEHRNRNTLNEMKRLLGRVSQMIVLSHSKSFLCPLWEGASNHSPLALKIDRVRDGQNQDASDINSWNVHSDCVSEHDHRHKLVRSYLETSVNADDRAVAEALRPILEAFIRVAYPGAFPPGELLGHFINKCDQRKGTLQELLSNKDIIELREITEYANEFHHDTNTAYKTVLINGTELTQWAERTLAFARRS